MSVDPESLAPFGCYTIEAAKAIAAAIEDAGATPAGVTGDIQFNNDGGLAAAPNGNFSRDPTTGETTIVTTSGQAGLQIADDETIITGGAFLLDAGPGGAFALGTGNPGEAIQIGSSTSTLSFFGSGVGGTQPTITGNTHTDLAALQGVVRSLLTALESLGLIIDSTT